MADLMSGMIQREQQITRIALHPQQRRVKRTVDLLDVVSHQAAYQDYRDYMLDFSRFLMVIIMRSALPCSL
jgi:hypothetical protein